MYTFITSLFLILSTFATGVWADVNATLFPCQVPVTYEVGIFDSHFGISQQDLVTALAEAEKVWEESAGLDLFAYKSGGRIKVNLLYDYRQQATDQLKTIGQNVSASELAYRTLEAKYAALSADYKQDKISFEIRLDEFNKRNAAYSAEVSKWNRRGGAPKDVYDELHAEQLWLQKESVNLDTLSKDLNNQVAEVNSLVGELNSLASKLNLDVARYNQVGAEVGEEFAEGLYVKEGFNKTINIYQFENRAQLVRVLAHELGHALGLNHVDDPKAIMYRLNQSTNNKPTEADLSALKTKCRIN